MIGGTFSIRVVDNVEGISYTALSIFHSISVSKSMQCIYNLGTRISVFRRRSRTRIKGGQMYDFINFPKKRPGIVDRVAFTAVE